MTPVSTNITLDITENDLQLTGLTKAEYIKQRSDEILLETIREWQSHFPYELLLRPTSSLPSVGFGDNTIRYSSDQRYFGAGGGVIGVTTIGFNTDTGDILSADILLNQGITGTTLTLDKAQSSFTQAYIGDVLTHEFGHFFGLSHSEVIGSSMVFSVFKGQHTVHEDDIAGVRKNYRNKMRQVNKGSLAGRVVADRDAKGIFGVNVNLFSIKKNQIVQSQLSDRNGRYFFEGLDINDSYYVRLEPLKKTEDISPYFSTINNYLCGTKEFRGTFFTKCGASSRGRPQVFAMPGGEDFIDMGDLTIRCDEGVNPYYYANKFKTDNRQTEILDWREKSSVYYGFFNFSELSQGLLSPGDEYTVDLRGVEGGNLALSQITLRLGVMTTGLGSNYDVRVYTRKINDTAWVSHDSLTEGSTGKTLTDRFIDLSLSSTASENLFELKVVPIPLAVDKEIEIFAAQKSRSDSIVNDTNLYILTVDVGTLVGNSLISLELPDSYPYTDNKLCLEGEVRFPSLPFVTKAENSDAVQPEERDNIAVGCGTIDLDQGGGGSGMSFILGLILILMLLSIKDLRDNLLSKS